MCCLKHFMSCHKVLMWAARVRKSGGHIAKETSVAWAPVSMTRLFKGVVFSEWHNLITLTNTLWNEKHVTGSPPCKEQRRQYWDSHHLRAELARRAAARAWASQKPGFSARVHVEQAWHYSEEYYDGIWFIAAANPDALFAFSALGGWEAVYSEVWVLRGIN